MRRLYPSRKAYPIIAFVRVYVISTAFNVYSLLIDFPPHIMDYLVVKKKIFVQFVKTFDSSICKIFWLAICQSARHHDATLCVIFVFKIDITTSKSYQPESVCTM